MLSGCTKKRKKQHLQVFVFGCILGSVIKKKKKRKKCNRTMGINFKAQNSSGGKVIRAELHHRSVEGPKAGLPV